ncbi:hypothetical protein [Roseitranquillus sediminis]|nr:hypothetical protein [Roseitranquillus sediminis]MBM9594803.1 hypothetical protein [Roseitranquillus sediminis]
MIRKSDCVGELLVLAMAPWLAEDAPRTVARPADEHAASETNRTVPARS